MQFIKATPKEIVHEVAQRYSEEYATLSLGAVANMLNEMYPDSAIKHLSPEQRDNIFRDTVKEIRTTYCING